MPMIACEIDREFPFKRPSTYMRQDQYIEIIDCEPRNMEVGREALMTGRVDEKYIVQSLSFETRAED
jgi:hypothetical protein